MPVKWISTKFRGVRYYESDTRKNGKRKDRYYAIRYQYEGNRKEEGLGWESDGWTGEKAALTLAELKQAQTVGEGPVSLREKRDLAYFKREAEMLDKERQKKDSITFSEYFDKTYYPISKTDKKYKSYIMEELHFRLWLNPIIGKKPLKSIISLDLERVKKMLLDDRKSPRTIQYVFATFRQIWNMARRDGLVINETPTKKVRLPKIDNERVRFLTINEEKKLLTKIRERDLQLHNMTLLSLRTGMRAAEIFNLKWGRIDTGKGHIIVLGKGDKSRVAFMTKDVKTMFKSMKKSRSDDYIFTIDGKIHLEVPRIFRNIVKELELNTGITDPRQRVCFHTCRHTFASRLVENGTDLYTVKELMGHSTLAMTERYAHLGQNTLQEAVKRLDKKLTKKIKRGNGKVIQLRE